LCSVVCFAAVNGLDNFRVGCLSSLPSEGTAIDTDSYYVCNDQQTGVTTGRVMTVGCASADTCQYVIIQSLDTVAEKLCIAEARVLETSQYIGNLCHLVLVSAATLLYLGLQPSDRGRLKNRTEQNRSPITVSMRMSHRDLVDGRSDLAICCPFCSNLLLGYYYFSATTHGRSAKMRFLATDVARSVCLCVGSARHGDGPP